MSLTSRDNPILREVIPDYVFDENVEYNEIGLVNIMIDNNLFSLTGPEIGHKVRIVAIGDPQAFDTISILYNPKIVDESEEVEIYEEVFPIQNLRGPVKRPTWLKVRYADPEGGVHTNTFHGLTARLLHRAIYQLDGRPAYEMVPVIAMQKFLVSEPVKTGLSKILGADGQPLA